MGVGAAEFFGADGHLFCKLRHGAGVVPSERVRDIIRAFEHEAVEHLHAFDAFAWLDGEAAFADRSVFVLNHDFAVEVPGFDD